MPTESLPSAKENLNWAGARKYWRAGIPVRRDAWRKWLLWPFPGVIDEPAAETLPADRRIALHGAQGAAAGDFGALEFLATDWTILPWAGGPPPPESAAIGDDPADEESGGSGSGGSGSSGSGSGSFERDTGPLDWSGGSGGGSGGGGGSSGGGGSRTPGRTKASIIPTITVTCTSITSPDGDGADPNAPCWDGTGDGPPASFRMGVNIAISGGPRGTGGLSFTFQGRNVTVGNGFDGYNATTIVEDATLTPGAFFAVSARYYKEGRNGASAGGFWSGDGTMVCRPVCTGGAPTPHTVTFYGNGSDGGATAPQTDDEPVALTPNGFTLTGSDFTGWNTAADGSGTAYADGAIYGFGADVTLYAQWIATPHTVVFDGNGSTGGATAPQTDDEPVALTANGFSRTGYDFTGWNTDAGGSGTAYADGATYSFAADLSLYAQWVVTPHTVTFAGNGSTGGSTAPQTESAATALTANGFTRSGYDFTGWNTDAGGSGTAYADGATYSFAADLALYAQWAATPHTVTFDGNGSDGGYTAPQTDDEPTALTANGFTLTGSAFDGWNTAADGSGTAYADGATYSFAADETLYAQWI